MKTLSMFMTLPLLCVAVASPAGEQPPAKIAETTQASAKQDESRAAEPAAVNRVELDTTQITGNRELPRVLYVVPWKRPDLGEASGKPAKSLLDEVLAPVDREVFRRQNRYHGALQPDGAAPRKVDAAGGER